MPSSHAERVTVMNILVATDGTLDVERAADAVERWYAEGDAVTVFTALNVPVDFLRNLGDSGVKEASTIALEAGQGVGDRAAEQLAHPRPIKDAPVDSPIMKALHATAVDRTEPLVAALENRGIKANATWTTTDNKTAKTILTFVDAWKAGLVVMGSHGSGRFEGLLGSTGTKIARRCPVSLLMIRNRNEG